VPLTVSDAAKRAVTSDGNGSRPEVRRYRHKKSVVVDSQFSLKPTFNGNLSAMAGG